MDSLDSTFTRWLFRAYLDLGLVPEKAPHHLIGVDFAAKSLSEGVDYPRIQSALNRSFRDDLINQVGCSEYGVLSPCDLPKSLRSDRWDLLCDFIETFDKQPADVQVRIAWLTSKLCFYDTVNELIPNNIMDLVGDSQSYASLAYLQCYSKYRLKIDNPNSDYSVDIFKEIAINACPGIALVDSHYQLVVQPIKDKGDLEKATYWQEKHAQAIGISKQYLSDFEYTFVKSRFHRVGGFLPQMRQDADGVIEEMNLAEEYARSLPRRSKYESIAADEALYPVLESRSKEAIWLGDYKLAKKHIEEALHISPYDARAWLQYGGILLELDDIKKAKIAYRRASWFSPPGKDIANYFIGLCCLELGDTESGMDAFLQSLNSDPLGLSTIEELVTSSDQLDVGLLNTWAKNRFTFLSGLAENIPEAHPEPYKEIPSP